MVVICTIEVGRSEHAALGPVCPLPADLHRLSSRESMAVLSSPHGDTRVMNAPSRRPNAVRGAPLHTTNDASEACENPFYVQKFIGLICPNWQPAARPRTVEPQPRQP